MSYRKQLLKFGAAGLGFVAASAQAAVPVAVTDAITTMGTDAATVAAAVFIVILAVAGIKFMRKGL